MNFFLLIQYHKKTPRRNIWSISMTAHSTHLILWALESAYSVLSHEHIIKFIRRIVAELHKHLQYVPQKKMEGKSEEKIQEK